MSATARSLLPLVAVKLLAVAMTAVVTLSAGVAYAAWIASGTGMSSARAVTAGPGNAPASAVSGRTVSLSWSASTYSNGVAVTTYLVKRYDAAGTTELPVASGTCAALVAGTSCSQTAAPSGSWKYTVTPAVGSWRGPESAQVAVSVGSPTVSLTPTLTRAGATLTGSVASFRDGESLTFRLDDATTGTVLVGTLGGVATPTAVPPGGGGTVTVVLPADTTSGAHTVYAVASPGAESAGQAITVDNTPPPAPSITGGPAGTVAATTATFTFTDAESPVTFRCALDGGAATTCTTGQSYSGLADGSHTFSVAAVDSAGNTSAATTRTWTVDRTGPANTVSFPVNGVLYGDASYRAGCSTPTADLCGTTSDATGVSTVQISILQVSTGRYWNGSSFSPLTEVMLTPTGTTSWSYASPAGVTLTDGSYTLRVLVTDTVGNTSSAASTFSYDATAPPKPTINTFPPADTASSTATFTFSDTEVGVAFRCSLDAGPSTSCVSPVTYTALSEANHLFTVTATDPAGNSDSTSYTWNTDYTAPTGTVTSPVSGSSYNTATYNALCGGADLCGTTADNLSGVQTARISIQDGAGTYWNGTAFASATPVLLTTAGSWTYALAATSLPDGAYTVRLYVTDRAGNVSAAIPSTWTMDRVAPPAPSITGGPGTPTASTAATFTFTDTEPGVTYLCVLDGGTPSACTTGKTYTGLADGTHTFAVTAVDAAGNISPATSATPWTVDSTSPVNTATFPVSGTTYSATTYNAGCSTGGGDLCGTTSDAVTTVSQVRVSIQRASGGLYWNGTAFASATESLRTPTGTTSWSLALTAASMADGSYTVRTYATDAAGNVSTTTSTFTMDTTPPPVPSITAGPAGTTASSTATFTFSDAEPGVTFLCSIDGGTALPCTSPTVYRALSNAAHTFSVTATDTLGNTSAAATRSWTVNAAVPGGALTFPVNSTTYNGSTWNAGCSTPAGDICGTAPAGTTAVALSIKQVSTGLYWTGAAFTSASESVVSATGTTAWSYSLTTGQLPDDSYTVRYYVTAASGNVSQGSTGVTCTVNIPLVPGAPDTTNTGVNGELDLGDALVLTTSSPLLPTSVLAGWGGSSTNVVVRVTHGGGGNDIMTIWDSTNTTQLKLGRVDLDDKAYVTADVTFGLSGTPSTIVQSGTTITITLGTVSDATKIGVGKKKGDMVWTPGVGATDSRGTTFLPTATGTETDNDKDF